MAFKFASSFVRSLFNPGTAPLPSITFAGDENTGIYSPGADQVGIATAGTARVVVDSAGLVSGTGSSLGAWNTVAYTPTVTAVTGTFTTVSATGRYTQIGKMVVGNAAITITTNGTAAGGVIFTLPVTCSGTVYSIGSGRADAISGKQLTVKISSTTQAVSHNYDNTYPGASGETLRVHFIYEAA